MRKPDHFIHTFAFAALLNMSCLTAAAQDVIVPREVEDITPPALQQARPPPRLVAPVTAADTPVFQAGPVTLRWHFLYRYLYGDGIPSAPGQQRSTAIHDIAPTFLFDIGSRWIIDYTPAWKLYSNSTFQDNVDHSVRLNWGTAYENWVLSASQSYSSTSNPLIETGRQTDQDAWSTAFGATYAFNSRMAFETSLNLDERYAEASPDYRDWSTQHWLQFQLSPQVNAAIGIGAGYTEILSGPDMRYYRPQARFTWQATDKINLSLQGGVEERDTRAVNGVDVSNPIFSASIDYQPFETTKFTFGVDRAVATSYFASQVTESTGWSAGFSQRLLGEFYLRVDASHRESDYVATTAGVAAGRADKQDTFGARLSTVLRGRTTLAIVYRHNRNSSNLSVFDLSSNQAGFEIGYRY